MIHNIDLDQKDHVNKWSANYLEEYCKCHGMKIRVFYFFIFLKHWK